MFLKKLSFLSFFVLSFLAIYLALSYISLKFLAKNSKISSIHTLILKTESVTVFDRKLEFKDELKKSLKSEKIGIFDSNCEILYVSDLSLNTQRCIEQADEYIWEEVHSPQKIYIVSLDKRTLFTEFWNDHSELYSVTTFIYFIIITFITFFVFFLSIDAPVKYISFEINKILSGNVDKLFERNSRKNFIVDELYNSILRLSSAFSNFEKEKAVLNLSRQIAHDIRSPLEALKSVSLNLSSLDSGSREIILKSISRISNIANGLLRDSSQRTGDNTIVNISILLDVIASDKKLEFDRDITLVRDIKISDSFIVANEGYVYRALSNIINNAFESYENNGEVIVQLKDLGSNILIEIIDYGQGISEDNLSRIKDGNFTTKQKGNGLGVSSAVSVFKKFGGTLDIKSKRGKGTTVLITIPKTKKPYWFNIDLFIGWNTKKIICIDDDSSFLELYKSKFKGLKFAVEYVLSDDIANVEINQSNQYFVDYDLGLNETGLDFIIKNNLQEQSTLVTSMYQDEEIQSLCDKHGIKILPKQIFNKAKIEFKETLQQVILIDDDKLIHLAWKMEAKKRNVDIATFFSVEEFVKNASQFQLYSKIYIDSDLGQGIRGEVESEKIFILGFTNLYLATGFEAKDINKPHWIKEVGGKTPRF